MKPPEFTNEEIVPKRSGGHVVELDRVEVLTQLAAQEMPSEERLQFFKRGVRRLINKYGADEACLMLEISGDTRNWVIRTIAQIECEIWKATKNRVI